MTMSPNVPSAPALQHFASVSDVTNIVRDFRSASPTYRPFKGKIPPKWHKAAGKKGYDITGRVKGRLHVALLCHDCGNTHTKRISVVLGYCRTKEGWPPSRICGFNTPRHWPHLLMESQHAQTRWSRR